MKKSIPNKFLSIMLIGMLTVGLMSMPVNVYAVANSTPEQEGNSIYLNGNDAEIVADPSQEKGAIVKSAGNEFKVTWEDQIEANKSKIYAGSKTNANHGTVNIVMNGGMVNYILGGNKDEGSINTVNMTINNGYVGIVHGSSRSSVARTLNDCIKNETENVNIVMNGGKAQALVPGSFGLTYVKNANVTLNKGSVAATTSPVQSGILGGTNGKVDNLTIEVNGGSTKDIALAQRTMITNKATVRVNGGNVGNIYAGSYYDDGDSAEGTNNWGNWGKGDVNYGQAKAIEIKVGKNANYNNIYAGFQFLGKTAFIEKYNAFNYDGTATIAGSENIKAQLILEKAPAAIRGNLEKHTVSMIDSKYANTTWKAADISLDQSTATLTPGESTTLKATLTPDKSADKISWTTSDEKVATVSQDGQVKAIAVGKATITAKVNGYSATCQVTVNPVEVSVPTVDTTKPIDKVTVGMNDKASQEIVSQTAGSIVSDILEGKAVSNIDKETAEKVKKAIEDKKTVTTEVQTQTVPEEKVNAKEKDVIFKLVVKETQEKKTTSKIVEYLDLKVLLKAGQEELGTVNKLDKEVAMTIAIPKDLVKEGRTFYIVRVHNGVAERLELIDNGDGTATFKTDVFSTYALVYEDKTLTTTPEPTLPAPNDKVQTSDNSQTVIYMTICGLAIAGSAIAILIRKKNELNHK